jgi:D-alanyl-D-alanine dipeptidase
VKRFVALLTACALVLFAHGEPPPAPIRDPQAAAVKELVDLAKLNAGFRFDLRYATPENFTKATLYPVAKAYLHRTAAEALVKVQRELAPQGLGLKIWDAYRPLSVQQRMWDLIRDDRYVSNPALNAGRHTRGTAIDVTLIDRDGKEMPMPTQYDNFSERAHREAKGIPTDAARNSKLLESTMLKHGFLPYPFEWWHFDFRDWKTRPPLDVPLDQLP